LTADVTIYRDVLTRFRTDRRNVVAVADGLSGVLYLNPLNSMEPSFPELFGALARLVPYDLTKLRRLSNELSEFGRGHKCPS
jgi:hypothetical protein